MEGTVTNHRAHEYFDKGLPISEVAVQLAQQDVAAVTV